MDVIAPYYKAVTAIIVPFLTQIGAGLLGPSDGGSTITPYEWISAIIISLVAGGAVFTVKNKDPNATHQDESVMPPDAV